MIPMKNHLQTILACLIITFNFNAYAESMLITNDVGITSINTTICSKSQNVQMAFKNFGSDTITSCTINWSVDGIQQAPYQWSGSLSSNASVSISPGSTNFTHGNPHRIKAWTQKRKRQIMCLSLS